MKIRINILPLFVLFGCQSESTTETLPEVDRKAHVSVANVLNDLASAEVKEGKEYRHHPASSKFRVDLDTKSTIDGVFDKVINRHGVFAVKLDNGSAHYVPNSDSQVLALPALTTNSDEHSVRVRKYFVDAGLPEGEIGGMHVTTAFKISGKATDIDRLSSRPQLVSYTSHVERYLSGIRVVGSEAWASFNANDEIMSESVYWPSIPKQIVLKAKEIKKMLEDKDSAKFFRQKVSANRPSVQIKSERVIIEHTSSFHNGKFDVFAAVEISHSEAGKMQYLKVNQAGEELSLPVEISPEPIKGLKKRAQ